MGEMVAEHTQSTDYQCNFNVNGAEESIITRYSAKKEVCSWQALMLTTDNFEKAKQKFKSLYSQLNNLSVNTGKANFRLKGVYESPEEKKKFTSVLFSFEPANESFKKLKVEISMQYIEPMEWKVKVLVYDRERDDVERGKTVEE
jgi:alpha-N-acetylglucosamine transferase